MASSPLECDICRTSFSEEHLPRILPCSHSFCGPCIDGIIATRKKTCPYCRREFTAASAEELVICRSLLDVIKTLGTLNKTLSKGIKRCFRGFPKESEEILTRDSITELLKMKNLSADIEILSEMRASVIDTNKTIEGSVEKLQQIKLSNEKILDSVNREIKCLKNKMILILQEEEGETQDAEVEAIASTSSSGPVMDEIPEGLLQEGQEDQRQRDDIVKEIGEIKTQLRNVAEEMKKAFEVDPLVISAEGDVPPRVAVKVIEGKLMVAPVRVKPENQVRLSHFAEGDVPPKSLIIEHEALMNGSSRRAFLDLALGETLRRVVIKVKDEGHLALNFLHLCAGDLGPSYANSHFSEVERKGEDCECIHVDGYKTSGGKTTRTAIIKQIDWNKERQREIYKHTPQKAGEVMGYFSDKSASRFFIVTRDDPNWSDNRCFGIVEEGLDALRDAILQYPDIEAVCIVDCGLMFPY